MSLETNINQLSTRIDLLEEKIDILATQINNLVSFGRLNGIRTLLEDSIRENTLAIATLQTEVGLIKTKLRAK
jgi:hypothetical protein